MPSHVLHGLDLAAPSIGACLADATLPDFPIIWVSPKFTEMTGIGSEDVRGHDLRILQRDQHAITFSPVQDETGRSIFMLGFHPDEYRDPDLEGKCQAMMRAITAHQHELRVSRFLSGLVTDKILQALHSGIIAVDGEGRILYANEAALALCNRTAAKMFGRTTAEVLGEELDQRARSLTRYEEHFECVFPIGNGERREAGFNLVRVVAPHTSDVACVFVFRDIQDRRQYELEMRRVKGLTALGQMAAGFAHEVRNPLAALRSLNECLLSDLAADDSRREYCTRMAALVGRIESLVDHSLRYARPRPPDRRHVSTLDVVHDSLEMLAPRFGDPSHSLIRVTAMDGLPKVEVDESQMVQVLVNLLENAADSTRDPGRVSIALFEAEHDGARFVVAEVIDDGPGLGLAIAQRLMQDNGGHLLSSSVPFKRTVFSMHMPVVVQGEPGPGSLQTT